MDCLFHVGGMEAERYGASIILRKVPLCDGDQIVDGEYPQSQKFQVEDLMGARCF